MVRTPLGTRIGFVALFLLGGTAVGMALAFILEFAASWQWGGFRGFFGIGASVGEPLLLAIGGALGFVLGAIVAIVVHSEALKATITDHAIRFTWDDAQVHVPRNLVTTIVMNSDIVIATASSVELARVHNALNSSAFRAALREHGYPEPRNSDPHESEFITWKRDDDSLSSDISHLLRARSSALASGAHADAELLRRSLIVSGIAVRDVPRLGRPRREQQWRRIRTHART